MFLVTLHDVLLGTEEWSANALQRRSVGVCCVLEINVSALKCKVVWSPALVAFIFVEGPQNGGNEFLRNVGTRTRNYMTSHPRRQ